MTGLGVRKKFRFIPFRRHDIVEMCLRDDRLSGAAEDFRALCHLLASVFHFEFRRTVEALKDAYAPIDPDADTRRHPDLARPAGHDFVALLRDLLEKANYEPVTEAALNQALSQSSLFRIRLRVDFTDFSEVLLFCRGESTRRETLPRWLGLGAKTIEFTNYDRVVIYLRFREDGPSGSDRQPSKPGATLLKLFQNVPQADLEMLFPNTRVCMRTIDKLLIGIPAVVSGGIVVTTKLGGSLVLLGSVLGFWLGLRSRPVEWDRTALMALLAGVVALGGYLWKQLSNFKNRKLRFMQALTQNLYFKNLDNNAGVIYRVADDAEEEECKEAILAYYLLHAGDAPLSKTALDREVEGWLATRWNCEVDFEIDDALRKLRDLGLVQEANGGLTAVPIRVALERLDRRWDDYFSRT